MSDVGLYTRVGRVAGRENYTWAGSVYGYHAAHLHVHVCFGHKLSTYARLCRSVNSLFLFIVASSHLEADSVSL